MLILGAAFIVALASLWALRRMARRGAWLDDAAGDPLKIHARPVPLVGGAGILFGVLAGIVVCVATIPSPVPLAGGVLVLVLSTAMFLVGLVDDLRKLTPRHRLLLELMAGVALVAVGARLGVYVPGQRLLGPALFSILGVIFVVGSLNAVNMQDGMDGLAGGLAIVTAVAVTAASAVRNEPLLQGVGLALMGALAGFLAFNLPPARLFMGDSGAYFLGFLLGALALQLGQGASSIRGLIGGGLLLALPLLDGSFAIVRRLATGRSPFAGDRSHLYDLLRGRGTSTFAVLLICYALHAVGVGAGLYLIIVPGGATPG